MSGISEDQRLPCQFFEPLPTHPIGQFDVGRLSILHQESANHGEVGIGTHTTFVVRHRVLALETATRLTKVVGIFTLLPVVDHISGEICQHLQEVLLHGAFRDEISCDDALCIRHKTLLSIDR